MPRKRSAPGVPSEIHKIISEHVFCRQCSLGTGCKEHDGKRFPSIKEVKIEALKFYTVREDDPIWADVGMGPMPNRVAFVRIVPPADATDAMLENVRQRFVTDGARVRVLRRQKPQVVLEQRKVKRSNQSIRAVVLQLTKEANTVDRETLQSLVENTLAGVGL
jgi:hypothetical protein